MCGRTLLCGRQGRGWLEVLGDMGKWGFFIFMQCRLRHEFGMAGKDARLGQRQGEWVRWGRLLLN